MNLIRWPLNQGSPGSSFFIMPPLPLLPPVHKTLLVILSAHWKLYSQNQGQTHLLLCSGDLLVTLEIYKKNRYWCGSNANIYPKVKSNYMFNKWLNKSINRSILIYIFNVLNFPVHPNHFRFIAVM